MRLIVTRPLPEGERTATALRRRGHQVLLAPLMRVEAVAADLTGQWAAVIVTSANAPGALMPAERASLIGLPLFAVGRRSAEAAREAGFTAVQSAEGDVNDLLRLLAERFAGTSAPLLYLAGEDRAADLPGELARRGIVVKTAVVYRAVTTGFPPALIAALEAGAVDAVLHYSRRSADNYLAGARAAGLLDRALSPRQICLSPQVAEPLAAAGAACIAVAARPDEAALIDLIERPQG
jgi:uroporphyrinogen-III synthase